MNGVGMSARRRGFFGALAVVAAVAIGAGVVVAVNRDRPGPLLDDPGVVPVVLVHGYGGDPSNMSTIDARLRALGRVTLLVTLPERGQGDIEDSVAEVDRVVAASGAEQVDLVGYSLGGVVVRAWAASESPAAEARHAVTLGSPHHGALLASAAALLDPRACAGACQQLRPRSAFLRELNEDETPGDATWVSVWTALDRTVVPPESAVLEGAVNVRLQDLCPRTRIGHGSINRAALPMAIVERALTERAVSASTLLNPPPGCE
jgi:triacylglycerol lipase